VTRGLKKLNVKPQLQVSTETLLEMWNSVTCKPNSNFGAGSVTKEETLSTRLVREEGISGDEFEQLVMMQLGMYIERSASKALAADTNSDPMSKTMLLVLKFLLVHTNMKGKVEVNHGDEPEKAEATTSDKVRGGVGLKGEAGRESGEAGLEEKVDILMVQQAEMMRMLVMLMDQREQEGMRENEEREVVLLLAERDKEREQQLRSAVQHHLTSALTSPITSPSPSRPQVPRPSPRDKEGVAGGYDLEVSLQNLLPSPRESKELSLEEYGRRHQAEDGGARAGRSQVAGARVMRGDEMADDWADEGAKGVRERELRREGRGEEKRAGERDRERELEKELDRYREREKEWERERQWQREREREQREGERERERVSLALSPASASSARDGERDRERELEKELERYRERDREWERERERETGRRNGGDMSGDRSSGRLGPQGMAEKGELRERDRERDQDMDIAREGERRREWERQRGKEGLDAPSLSQGEHVKWDKQRPIVPPLW
jgi:hypothetical protein